MLSPKRDIKLARANKGSLVQLGCQNYLHLCTSSRKIFEELAPALCKPVDSLGKRLIYTKLSEEAALTVS